MVNTGVACKRQKAGCGVARGREGQRARKEYSDFNNLLKKSAFAEPPFFWIAFVNHLSDGSEAGLQVYKDSIKTV